MSCASRFRELPGPDDDEVEFVAITATIAGLSPRITLDGEGVAHG